MAMVDSASIFEHIDHLSAISRTIQRHQASLVSIDINRKNHASATKNVATAYARLIQATQDFLELAQANFTPAFEAQLAVDLLDDGNRKKLANCEPGRAAASWGASSARASFGKTSHTIAKSAKHVLTPPPSKLHRSITRPAAQEPDGAPRTSENAAAKRSSNVTDDNAVYTPTVDTPVLQETPAKTTENSNHQSSALSTVSSNCSTSDDEEPSQPTQELHSFFRPFANLFRQMYTTSAPPTQHTNSSTATHSTSTPHSTHPTT